MNIVWKQSSVQASISATTQHPQSFPLSAIFPCAKSRATRYHSSNTIRAPSLIHHIQHRFSRLCKHVRINEKRVHLLETPLSFGHWIMKNCEKPNL